jgi:hypothetical protein
VLLRIRSLFRRQKGYVGTSQRQNITISCILRVNNCESYAGTRPRQRHLTDVSTDPHPREKDTYPAGVIVTGGRVEEEDETIYIKEMKPREVHGPADNIHGTNKCVSVRAVAATPAVAAGIAGDYRRDNYWTNVTRQEDDELDLACVYGATLTPLDDHRAVRFGGFNYTSQTSQVAVLRLNRKLINSRVDKQNKEMEICGFGSDESIEEPDPNYPSKYIYRAEWEIKECSLHQRICDDVSTGENNSNTTATDGSRFQMNLINDRLVARAYHTATLLFDRYLLVVGGTQRYKGSILEPILLDTKTWTWYMDIVTSSTAVPSMLRSMLPSPRHGHSIVADLDRYNFVSVNGRERDDDDSTRNNIYDRNSNNKDKELKTRSEHGQLVLFGGSTESHHRLRSAIDNTEIWEIRLNLDRCFRADNDGSASQLKGCCKSTSNLCEELYHCKDFSLLERSLPWTWNCLALNSDIAPELNYATDDNGNGATAAKGCDASAPATSNEAATEAPGPAVSPTGLSASERLILGCCHGCVKVAPDMVLLMFGSAWMPCNGAIGYNLATDAFVRPTIQGPVPPSRFTFAYTYIRELGYILIHGGYSSEQSDCLDDVVILDVAATLPSRRLKRYHQHHETGTTSSQLIATTSFIVNNDAQSHKVVSDTEALAYRNRNRARHDDAAYFRRHDGIHQITIRRRDGQLIVLSEYGDVFAGAGHADDGSDEDDNDNDEDDSDEDDNDHDDNDQDDEDSDDDDNDDADREEKTDNDNKNEGQDE